jgi:hypothetical protein
MAALTFRDELLRAAVYEAFDARPGIRTYDAAACPRYLAACSEVVRVHRVAPLLELRPVLAAFADWLDERRMCDEAAELAWYDQIERRELRGRACAA